MAVYQDGTFPSGAPVVVINSVNYKANSFTYDKSANTTQITNEDGEHSGALSFSGPLTGSMELQFESSSTPEPTTAAANSTTGVFVANINSSNVNCFITSVAIAKPAAGPWVATCAWQAKVN